MVGKNQFIRARSGIIKQAFLVVAALLFGVATLSQTASAASGDMTEFVYAGHNIIQPKALTKGSDGNIWFISEINSGVGKVTPTGTITYYPSTVANYYPQSIRMGSDGNLWTVGIADGQGTLVRVKPNGKYTQFPLPDGASYAITPGPDSFVYDGRGHLWFPYVNAADNTARMAKFAIGKKTYTTFPLPYGVMGMGVDGNGILWMGVAGGNGSDLVRMNQQGVTKVCPARKTGTFVNAPVYSTTDANGNVWLANYRFVGKVSNCSIERVSAAADELMVSPTGIAVDASGNAWVSHMKFDDTSVYAGFTKFASDGTTQFYETPSNEYGTAIPTQIVIGSDGNLWGGVMLNRIVRLEL